MPARRPLREEVRRRPWPWLLGATLASLAGAWVLKARCVGLLDFVVPKVSCYTDIGFLYTARGLDQRLVPYIQSFNEYPPATGLFQWLLAWLSWSAASFFVWNAAALGALAVATTWVLLRLAGPDGADRVLVWCLGPPLALYAFYNWDLLPVFLTAAALLAWRRGRLAAAGALLGLGAAAKWYPAVVAVVLAALLLDRRRRKDLGRFAAGGAATLAATNVPFLLGNAGLFLESYRFHLGRQPNPDTLWAVAAHYAGRLGWGQGADLALHAIHPVLALATLAGVAGVAWAARSGRIPLLPACLAALLVFLVLNKVFSIQYALWVLPFLALLRVPWGATALLFLTTLLADITQRGMYEGHAGAALEAAWDKMAPWIVLRHAALAWMLAWCLRQREEGVRDGRSVALQATL